MNEEQRNTEYRQIADKIIDTANDLIDDKGPAFVGSAALFGIARFCAFSVASQADDLTQYEGELAAARQYYLSEFERMLDQNLEDYKAAFDAPLKYEHLMKSGD